MLSRRAYDQFSVLRRAFNLSGGKVNTDAPDLNSRCKGRPMED